LQTVTGHWRIIICIAAFVGVGASIGETRYKCRKPLSEACVWSRSLRAVTMPLYSVGLGLPIAVAAVWARSRARRQRDGTDGPDVDQ
jgi:hypothetical protein